MILLSLALVYASPTCTETRQQCRACPTEGSVKGCSTVGIACQPTRRICEPVAPANIATRPGRGADRSVDKKTR
ncbi:hypothetical protein [Sphingomonas albertensis]|uniref:Uncharacterized protein n=1 Tax=Sphingomonas albertensis TaxID=2762591 RepID=A0ABR7ARV3_9SPHN|nr:hypothetical protein [Sphingomonas albertensis]MBC3942682.1 hypothetical protein [Sphingomonas albertensis]